MGHFKSHILKRPEEYGEYGTNLKLPLSVLASTTEIGDLSDVGLLAQTGYLTIKLVVDDNVVILNYPNLGVSRAMALLYEEQLLGGRLASQIGAGKIKAVLEKEFPESLFHVLNKVFCSIDYQRYPVTDEASVRAIVQVYMAGCGLSPRIETHNTFGRSDLEVTVGERVWIIEFKVSHSGHDTEGKLPQALSQIKERRYGMEHSCLQTIKMAMVFSVEKRCFTSWRSFED